MAVYKKIKNSNGRVHHRIFGVKILSHKAKTIFKSIDSDLGRPQWYAKCASYADFISDKGLQEYIKKILAQSESIRSDTEFIAINGWCEICGKTTQMKTRPSELFFMHMFTCQSCVAAGALTVSRTRAMYEFARGIYPPPSGSVKTPVRVYMDEAVTDSFRTFQKLYGPENVVGAEYMGPDKICGHIYNGIMHQDATRLSFTNDEFDLIISQHVLEHIPDYKQVLAEYLRVLKPGGKFAVSIPFNDYSEKTVVRAEVLQDGTINHIMPPEIHGNPVDSGGSLAFYNHGWEFLDAMRQVGFEDVNAHYYYNPTRGHFGLHMIICGTKPK